MLRVIKLGGSLLTLPDWHERFLRWLAMEPPGVNLLLIGGGELVDALRREHERFPYTERQMHFAALAAMDINAQLALPRLPTALLVEGPGDVQEVDGRYFQKKNVSWLGIVQITKWWHARDEAEDCLPPMTWETTSDTLAAWIADYISDAELVLLKSTEPPRYTEDWTSQGYVDRNFFQHLSKHIPLRAVNLRASKFD